jgi:hypothetical protein
MGTYLFAKVLCKSRDLCGNFCKAKSPTYYAVCIYALTGFSVPSLPNTRFLEACSGCDVGCSCHWRDLGLPGLALAHPPPPCWRVACHLLSQAAEPLALPRRRCNLLLPKPFAPTLPAGIGFAFSERGDSAAGPTARGDAGGAAPSPWARKRRRGFGRWIRSQQGGLVCSPVS